MILIYNCQLCVSLKISRVQIFPKGILSEQYRLIINNEKDTSRLEVLCIMTIIGHMERVIIFLFHSLRSTTKAILDYDLYRCIRLQSMLVGHQNRQLRIAQSSCEMLCTHVGSCTGADALGIRMPYLFFAATKDNQHF